MQAAANPNTRAHHNDTGPQHLQHVCYSGISRGLVMSMQLVHIFGLYLWGCKPLYLWNPSHDLQDNFHLWTWTHCRIGSVFMSYFASLWHCPFVVSCEGSMLIFTRILSHSWCNSSFKIIVMIQTYSGPNLSEGSPFFYPFKIQFIHCIGSQSNYKVQL